jgi:hypothetical protein
MFGIDRPSPLDHEFASDSTSTAPSVDQVDLDNRNSIFQLVKDNMSKFFENAEKRHPCLVNNKFKVGSLVKTFSHRLSDAKKKFNAKLGNHFNGPFVIIEFPSPNVALLRDAHIKDCNPFKCHLTELNIWHPRKTGSIAPQLSSVHSVANMKTVTNLPVLSVYSTGG